MISSNHLCGPAAEHLQELCQQLELEKTLENKQLSNKIKKIQNKSLDVSGVLIFKTTSFFMRITCVCTGPHHLGTTI